MDLSKSYDFFQPEMVRERIHIIGCGSVGSTLAELLARFGLTKISLYDFDIVKPHNLANQMFTQQDVGKMKVAAVAERLQAINPLINEGVKIIPEGWTGQRLGGYVFLAVDNIELRHRIASTYLHSPLVKAMFDFRTRLTDAQHYAVDWRDMKGKESFIESMNFTQEEARENTPVSACNVELSVAPTVWNICTAGVSNFVNFITGKELKKIVLLDAFNFTLTAI